MDSGNKDRIREQETVIRTLKNEIASMKDVVRAQEKELQALRKLNQKQEESLKFYQNTLDRIFQMTEEDSL